MEAVFLFVCHAVGLLPLSVHRSVENNTIVYCLGEIVTAFLSSFFGKKVSKAKKEKHDITQLRFYSALPAALWTHLKSGQTEQRDETLLQ